MTLLGGFELCDADGSALPLPYDKVRALLALLALQSGPLTRETLAELLWPDSELAQARANLRRALFDLRLSLSKLLPKPALETLLVADKKHIQLHDSPALVIDCREFTLAQLDAAAPHTEARRLALERARALYRGELLIGLSLSDAPGFNAWRPWPRCWSRPASTQRR
ncbi:AfsR/SARP family transcriptional regulator [Roseateles cavernae]|uniref:AfsR/SARP family transcriptional regulator n=1 Tax=Roseateles cavernae TaxID=3153578 RepID=UPI0032E4D7CF